VWQWLHHGAHLNDGRKITIELVKSTIASVMEGRTGGKFPLAAQLFEQMMVSPDLKEFLTLEAYRYL